uniref:Uncharacterized protein n=1 Tax=Panagrolaimus superbus TaxID=310955 RepID=A0A914Y1D5_9BILA
MLTNALAYFSPPSTPRKSVMQFFENLNPLNSFKSDPDHSTMASHISSEAGISGHDKSHDIKSLKSVSKNPLTPKSAGATFSFSNNTIVPTTSSVYPTTLSPAAIILEKPPSGRASRPLSMIMGKKKPPPPPPCNPSTSISTTEISQEIIQEELDPEILAGALVKAGLIVEEKEAEAEAEEIETSPALFPPRPPKPNHLSRSSSIKPVSPSPSTTSADTPPPLPPKTYKKVLVILHK